MEDFFIGLYEFTYFGIMQNCAPEETGLNTAGVAASSGTEPDLKKPYTKPI